MLNRTRGYWIMHGYGVKALPTLLYYLLKTHSQSVPVLNERLTKIREAPHVPEAVSCPSDFAKSKLLQTICQKKEKHRSLIGCELQRLLSKFEFFTNDAMISDISGGIRFFGISELLSARSNSTFLHDLKFTNTIGQCKAWKISFILFNTKTIASDINQFIFHKS